jgi:aminobenzoyl-glutamate utilization protein B
MNSSKNWKDFAVSWLDHNHESFFPYSDAIWSFAELGCEEFLSSELLKDLLKRYGFAIRPEIAGMPTSFVASWGQGKPVIGWNCEYDALPGLSQHPGPERRPVIDGAPGHGCGHNLLGVGSIMAAMAVREWQKRNGSGGTLMIFGTPAEELCLGKPYIARAGLFNGLDALIDWHPSFCNTANYDTCNAYFSVKYHFRGRAAHGNAPWMGRSAVDAAMLMGQAIEILREHIPPGFPNAANTINYNFPDMGPEYPNVVSDHATVWVIGRITTSEEMEKIIKRIDNCAKAAGLVTETSWQREFLTATHERMPNRTLSSVLFENLLEIGPPRFDSSEQELVRKMQQVIGVDETGLQEDVIDFQGGNAAVTDNSEYSWFAPFAMLRVTIAPANIGWHNWQVTALARSSIGKKAMLVASKVLASSAIELLSRPQILEKAWTEFSKCMAGRTYNSFIPNKVDPPLHINQKAMEKYRPLMKEHYQDKKESEKPTSGT